LIGPQIYGNCAGLDLASVRGDLFMGPRKVENKLCLGGVALLWLKNFSHVEF
jgi:hypothetical protein